MLVAEGMRDIEFSCRLIGNFLLSTRYCDNLELVEQLQRGDVAVFCPAPRANNTYPELIAAHTVSLKHASTAECCGEPAEFDVRVPVLNRRRFETHARRADPNRFAVTHTF